MSRSCERQRVDESCLPALANETTTIPDEHDHADAQKCSRRSRIRNRRRTSRPDCHVRETLWRTGSARIVSQYITRQKMMQSRIKVSSTRAVFGENVIFGKGEWRCIAERVISECRSVVRLRQKHAPAVDQSRIGATRKKQVQNRVRFVVAGNLRADCLMNARSRGIRRLEFTHQNRNCTHARRGDKRQQTRKLIQFHRYRFGISDDSARMRAM